MEKLGSRIFGAALGIWGAAFSLVSVSSCTGRACSSCYGCAGAGIGLVLAALVCGRGEARDNIKNDTEDGGGDGMA